MLYQANAIPHYPGGTGMGFGALLPGNVVSEVVRNDVIPIVTAPTPLTAQEALALDEYGGAVLDSENAHRYYSSYSSVHLSPITIKPKEEWTPEDVAKGMQDYLVCIEMFAFAIIHIFVFSHTEYDPQAVEARRRSLMQQPHKDWNKRLGRKWKEWDNKSAWSGTTKSSQDWISLPANTTTNTTTTTHQNPHGVSSGVISTGSLEEDDLLHHPMDKLEEKPKGIGRDDEDEDDDDERRERTPLMAASHCEADDGSFDSGIELGVLNDDESISISEDAGQYFDEESPQLPASAKGRIDGSETTWSPRPSVPKTGFVKALWDSAIPQDLRDNTVGIIKGDYVVEKKTLLHHAATSDSYDLFTRFNNKPRRGRPTSIYTVPTETVEPTTRSDEA